MNYLEGLQFASACATLAKMSKDGIPDQKEMAKIWKQQSAVMTVRGAARDEYFSSMDASRI